MVLKVVLLTVKINEEVKLYMNYEVIKQDFPAYSKFVSIIISYMEVTDGQSNHRRRRNFKQHTSTTEGSWEKNGLNNAKLYRKGKQKGHKLSIRTRYLKLQVEISSAHNEERKVRKFDAHGAYWSRCISHIERLCKGLE